MPGRKGSDRGFYGRCGEASGGRGEWTQEGEGSGGEVDMRRWWEVDM